MQGIRGTRDLTSAVKGHDRLAACCLDGVCAAAVLHGLPRLIRRQQPQQRVAAKALRLTVGRNDMKPLLLKAIEQILALWQNDLFHPVASPLLLTWNDCCKADYVCWSLSFDSTLFSVVKNRCVATIGPHSSMPKMFQPNICHHDV